MYTCKTGEQAESYTEYLNTEHWNNTKQRMYKFYYYECVFCRKHKGLHVHHKTYEHIGNEPLKDLVYVCPTCHKLLHENPALLIANSKYWTLKPRLKGEVAGKRKKKKSTKKKR